MQTLITLHSGAMGTEPNSQDYLEVAAKTQPDIVELDIRNTLDGIIVLHHDPCIMYAGRLYDISKHAYHELKQLKPKLLSLREGLLFCRKHNLFVNLDVKTSSVIMPAINVIKSMQYERDVVFSGCYPDYVSGIRTALPSARLLLAVDDPDIVCDSLYGYMVKVKNIINTASIGGFCGLNIHYKNCRNEFIQYASKRMLPVCVWTINDFEEMKYFYSSGVYSITTDRIDYFMRIVPKRHVHYHLGEK